MPSTYTTNLGIEKIATGEQSGTWGATTNTNLDLLDEAVNGVEQVTLAAAGSSGSPNDLPISNGSSSDGRNKFIEFIDGGDLGGTAFVQLTPNDAEKVVFIRNSLSAARDITIFQGTYNASNDFVIPNGADVVLKFDGAGSGAVVSDVYVNLTPTKLTTADLVATTADINGGSVDGATLGTNSAITEAQVDNINIDGNAITSTDTNGDITISPNGTGTVVIDTDLDVDNININGNTISSTDTNGNIALTPDGTGEVDISKVDIDSGTIDDTTIGGSTPAAGSFTGLTLTGDATFGDNDKAIFGAGSDLQIYHTGNHSYINESGTGNLRILCEDLAIEDPAGGDEYLTAVRDGAVTLYYDNAQKLATTNTGIDVTGTVTADGLTVDGAFTSNGIDDNADATAITIDSSERVLIGGTSSQGVATPPTDMSLQVQGDDFSTSAVCLQRYQDGVAGPSILFAKTRSGTVGSGRNIGQDGDELGKIRFYGADGVNFGSLAAEISAEIDGTPGANDMPARLVFETTADGASVPTERMVIKSSGNVGIGATDPFAVLTTNPESGNFNATYNSYDGVGLYLLGNGTNGDGNYGPAVVFGACDSSGTNEGDKHCAISSVQTGADPNETGLAFWTHPTNTSTDNLVEQARIRASGDFAFNSGYGSAATAYGVRAWVNFDGTGTVAIRDDGNVSSITDGGTGDYTLNFTTAFPDNDYAASFGGKQSSGGSTLFGRYSATVSTTQLRTIWVDNSDTSTDGETCAVMVVR